MTLPELNDYMLGLLKQSLGSDGVSTVLDSKGKPFSLFDPKFLGKIAKMEERNLAIEMIRKLIVAQVGEFRRTNVVRAEEFSKLFTATMNKYLKGVIDSQTVINELLKMAKEIEAAKKKGDALGLSAEELAFYDALTKPQAVFDFYTNESLIKITKELVKAMRENWTRDWQTRENERAKMRMMVMRLLKIYKYPPEGQEEALKSVIAQCEH